MSKELPSDPISFMFYSYSFLLMPFTRLAAVVAAGADNSLLAKLLGPCAGGCGDSRIWPCSEGLELPGFQLIRAWGVSFCPLLAAPSIPRSPPITAGMEGALPENQWLVWT